jgi:hypothetical protein
MESAPGTDLGLFYTKIDFVNYVLRLEWLTCRDDDNSGVFLRFPDPATIDYNNNAFVGVDFGFEVQIDALGRGSPPQGQNVDKKFRTTGAIYNIANQTLEDAVVANAANQWNKYEIIVTDNRFRVLLNGQQKTDFVNADAGRGKADTGSRYIGLQTHTGRVLFRNIQIQGLP